MKSTESFKPFLALSASAGSGKTFALSIRYLSLLFLGESPGSILAATFTNKAAAEMRHRVTTFLREMEEKNNSHILRELSRATGLRESVIVASRKDVLDRFLASPAHIVTLDSFFVSVLRSGALEVGLDPAFVTKEESDNDLEGTFLEYLDRDGLIETLVQLALQMQKRKAGDMMERMQAFYRADPLLRVESPRETDIHSIESEIESLRESLVERVLEAGGSNRAANNFISVTTGELFAKSLFDKESLYEHSYYKKALSIDPGIEELYQELRRALLEWARARESNVLYHIFELYSDYKRARFDNIKRGGVLDFDDLLLFAYHLLHEAISRDFLYFRLDSRFRHILLDEFQDTSTMQFLLLAPLIDEIFSGKGQSEFRSFFYVGDVKQSLYRFRGGDEELFGWVSQRYGIPVMDLKSNYRSHRIIVDQVNTWFLDKMPGYVPQSAHSEKEGYLKVDEAEEPADAAVREAARLIDQGIAPEEIAFLVTTNKDGLKLQEACEKAGIPTRLQTSSSLKHLPSVASIVKMAEYLYGGEAIDAAPLLKKSGMDISDVDISWYRPTLSPLELIDGIVRTFSSFDADPNILRLLEYASGFDSIPEFLKEFELSRIAVADKTLDGAPIMTIHGSKGLQFAYVVVLDRFGRSNADRSPFLFHYDENLSIDRIYYRLKGRERFDPKYDEIVRERKAKEDKDRLNLLYVALTRAQKGLVVIKKPKDSIFEVLHMEELEKGEIEPTQRDDTLREREKISLRFASWGRQRYSQGREDAEEGESGAFGARLFGTAMHYALEMMGMFDEGSLELSMESVRNRFGSLLSEKEISEIRSRIEALIAVPQWMEITRGASLRKEQPLIYRDRVRQIDLMVERKDSVIVVDYKSSMSFSSKHKEQIREYMEAVRSIGGKDTHGYLVYLLHEGVEIVRVDQSIR